MNEIIHIIIDGIATGCAGILCLLPIGIISAHIRDAHGRDGLAFIAFSVCAAACGIMWMYFEMQSMNMLGQTFGIFMALPLLGAVWLIVVSHVHVYEDLLISREARRSRTRMRY